MAGLGVWGAGRDNDVAVGLHGLGVGGVLLVFGWAVEEALAEEVVDGVGEEQFLFWRV